MHNAATEVVVLRCTTANMNSMMSTDSLDCTTSAELSNNHDYNDTLHESAEENGLPHLDTLESGSQNGTRTSQAIALPSSPTLTDELRYYMLCCKEYGMFCPNNDGASR
jgi:hypothetical protein